MFLMHISTYSLIFVMIFYNANSFSNNISIPTLVKNFTEESISKQIISHNNSLVISPNDTSIKIQRATRLQTEEEKDEDEDGENEVDTGKKYVKEEKIEQDDDESIDLNKSGSQRESNDNSLPNNGNKDYGKTEQQQHKVGKITNFTDLTNKTTEEVQSNGVVSVPISEINKSSAKGQALRWKYTTATFKQPDKDSDNVDFGQDNHVNNNFRPKFKLSAKNKLRIKSSSLSPGGLILSTSTLKNDENSEEILEDNVDYAVEDNEKQESNIKINEAATIEKVTHSFRTSEDNNAKKLIKDSNEDPNNHNDGKNDKTLISQAKQNKMDAKAMNANKIVNKEESSNFMTYLTVGIVFIAFFYVVYHNRAKIMAFIVEGRNSRSSGSRRYRRVSTNLEDDSKGTPNSEVISEVNKSFIY